MKSKGYSLKIALQGSHAIYSHIAPQKHVQGIHTCYCYFLQYQISRILVWLFTFCNIWHSDVHGKHDCSLLMNTKELGCVSWEYCITNSHIAVYGLIHGRSMKYTQIQMHAEDYLSSFNNANKKIMFLSHIESRVFCT